MTADNKQAAEQANQTTEKKKKSLFTNSKIFTKLKSIKHIEIYIAVILGAIILLIYFSSFNSTKQEDATSSEVKYTSINQYAKEIQNQMEHVLSKVKGAGEVDVLIIFETGIELIIAYSIETKEVTSGTTTTVTVVKTPILVNKNGSSEPIILSEKLPLPKSVVVVASGAKDVKVKLDLLMAVQTALNLPSSSIEILAGN